MLTSRKDEGLILVKQNNEAEQLTIEGLNETAQQLLGYGNTMVGHDFTEILGDKSAELIQEYIEYEDDAYDLQQLLGKKREIELKTSNGKTITNEFKIFRSEAQDKHQWFRIILKDKRQEREEEAFKEVLRANFKGHEVLDEGTDLPDRESIIKDIELAGHYSAGKGIPAGLIYARISNMSEMKEKYGEGADDFILMHVARFFKNTLREDDVVGRAAEDALAIILMNAEEAILPMLASRLRSSIVSNYDSSSSKSAMLREITLSFGYKAINADTAAEQLLQECRP